MHTAPEQADGLDELVSFVRESPCSGFYRDKWNKAEKFAQLPYVSRADLVAAPLSSRRYKREKGMVKIIGAGEQAFLSEWSFADIGRESYARRTLRPFVYMTDPYEAVEKAMWCYENGMTPLIGEKDPGLAMYAASRYRIDSLICDEGSLMKFTPFFSALTVPVSCITVIGSAFSPDVLMPFERYAHAIRLVLALPETGAFAEASLTPAPAFTPLPGCIIEHDSGIILTKIARYPTPVIRYQTGIASGLIR